MRIHPKTPATVGWGVAEVAREATYSRDDFLAPELLHHAPLLHPLFFYSSLSMKFRVIMLFVLFLEAVAAFSMTI